MKFVLRCLVGTIILAVVFIITVVVSFLIMPHSLERSTWPDIRLSIVKKETMFKELWVVQVCNSF